ncbi:MAG: hypothetical protein N7Q72_03660, partial [Spiroplasma sp. Tabriz.8]|nr:hypothetical protein [Spiroplasma sp. Tabriz.8]
KFSSNNYCLIGFNKLIDISFFFSKKQKQKTCRIHSYTYTYIYIYIYILFTNKFVAHILISVSCNIII